VLAWPGADLSGELRALAERLGDWPLLLGLGNAWLRKRVVASRQPLAQALVVVGKVLDKHGITAFDAQNPTLRDEAAARSLELSLEGLTSDDSARLQERGSLLQCLRGHEGSVNGALLMPDGQRVLSWSEDKTLLLWDLEHGSLLQGQTSTTGALLVPDGQRALSWSYGWYADRTLLLWDLERGSLLQCLQCLQGQTSIIGALLMADGQRALSWSLDNRAQFWDLERGSLLSRLQGHLSCSDWPLTHVCISDAQDHVLAFDQSGRLHLLRLNT